MNNCFLMLSLLKIHVILFMDIVVVLLLCFMLDINDDVLYRIVSYCLDLPSTRNPKLYVIICNLSLSSNTCDPLCQTNHEWSIHENDLFTSSEVHLS